jgi:hypothetical protein
MKSEFQIESGGNFEEPTDKYLRRNISIIRSTCECQRARLMEETRIMKTQSIRERDRKMEFHRLLMFADRRSSHILHRIDIASLNEPIVSDYLTSLKLLLDIRQAALCRERESVQSST